MKTLTRLCLLLLITAAAQAQQKKEYTKMFRLYEDNDFINFTSFDNDEAYTNGTRFDLFYQPKERSRSIMDCWMPKAGKASVNTYGYGFMQTMFTPSRLMTPDPDPADFYYSGGLFVTHTQHSSNPEKKYNIQTELLLGVMGPPALAESTQRLIHSIMNYRKPAGWDKQLKTDLLLNLNIIVEKELVAAGDYLQVSGGAQGFLGTMVNGMAVYSNIRIGRMTPYYNGYIQQYSSGDNWQLYGTIRPSLSANFHNSLVSGGYFSSLPYPAAQPADERPFAQHKILPRLDVSIAASIQRWGFSISQKTTTPVVNGLSDMETGNLSIYYSW
ncbi:lipid A-modifier LpxR family protein [Chitinophaga sp. sic0106]|uniref:lipid A-modifier LpxR family protein n=1 Tax=Chitinophaga sp. sic0106 TaxID=2854785 RepID=UPI001C45C9E2|nr:lipid A-modifier LpxR family protein [Chitinophaga sp. sic0106]MBV7529178.1 lipid A deacylase LpxR family protein [Chitinophaga sp. sic0106]